MAPARWNRYRAREERGPAGPPALRIPSNLHSRPPRRSRGDAGLAIIEPLGEEPILSTYHLLPAVRGDLLDKLDRKTGAAAETSGPPP